MTSKYKISLAITTPNEMLSDKNEELIIGIQENGNSQSSKNIFNKASKGLMNTLSKRKEFSGKINTSCYIPALADQKDKKFFLLGLGNTSDKFKDDDASKLIAKICTLAKTANTKKVSLFLPEIKFEKGLKETISWYLKNKGFLKSISKKSYEKRFGLVGDNFNKEKVLNNLKGNYAIGHNRYSTTGNNTLRNIQPFFADTNAGGIGVSHNGNLTNSISLRKKLVEEGAIFYTTSDTETIVQLIAKSKRSKTIDKVIDAIFQIQGGYALVTVSYTHLTLPTIYSV